MATLFFGYSWRPLEPQQRNLKIICHLCHSSSSSRSSLSGGRRLVLLSDILFLFFPEFSLEIKGRVSRWSHKVALFNGQTISATRCHFIKQKRIKFIQNWHVQSGAVSFVSGRVRLQMTMLSDCWLLHPIKKSVDRWSSVDLLGQKLPPSVSVSPPRPRPFSFILPAPTRLNFAKWTKWRRISFIRNGRCCGSTFCAEISIGCLDWYIFDTDGSNRFRWLPTNRIKMFKRTFLPARPSLAIVIRHLPKVAE